MNRNITMTRIACAIAALASAPVFAQSYALQAFQRTNGNMLGTAGSGHIITATATIGDGFQSAPSSSRSQFAAGVGIVHRF
jgi:hypothetical protein